jgi:ankyrin repeat protein
MKIKKLINSNNWDKIYEKLAKNKIKPDTEISNGNSIIHLAAINNNEKIINYYLKKDNNILQKSNDEGNTPVHLLAIYGYVDLLKECIKVVPEFLNLQNNNNETISLLLYNDLDFIKWIQKYKPNNLLVNNINGENIYTKNLYDTNNKNDIGYKIIKYIISNNKKEINKYDGSLLSDAIKENKPHIAKLLINNKYDINKRDSRYISPFIYAVKNKNYDLINSLIKHGADINYCGPEGDYNPMIWTIINNEYKLIDLLLENNFNINNYNRYLETPLHYALYNKPYNSKITPTIISKLLYYGDLNIKNVNGQTPLHLLCKYHHWKNYSSIINRKELDIFIEDKANKRPFDYLNGNYIYDFIDVVVNSYTRLLDGNINYIDQCRTDLKSFECRSELKKYIFKTKRSIPLVEDNILMNQKINIITGTTVQHGLFNSDSLHNMIYMIQIMKKYKNIGLPFQYYINDKYINDKIQYSNNNLFKQPNEYVISDLVSIYMEYFYELLPYLIIWRSPTQYFVHHNLEFLLKKCLSSTNIRFVVLKLTLVTSPNSTHANIIIYDKINNTLERFEPYGTIPYLNNVALDNFIYDLGKRCFNSDLKYYKPKDIFGMVGFQTISNDSNPNVKKLGDPMGYCLSWTFWYLEMKISNPDVHPSIFIKQVMRKITDNDNLDGEKLFISFIRNYASELDKAKNTFMIESGVNLENVYNLALSSEDQTKVKNYLVSEFKKIIKERY